MSVAEASHFNRMMIVESVSKYSAHNQEPCWHLKSMSLHFDKRKFSMVLMCIISFKAEDL